MDDLEKLLADAVKKALAEQTPAPAAAEMVAKADVEKMIADALKVQAAEFETKLAQQEVELAKKAFDRVGVGRVGDVQPELNEQNALERLVAKAKSVKSHDELEDEERRAIGILTVAALMEGLKD